MVFCPYCKNHITMEAVIRETSNKFFKSRDEIMYSCPHCQRVLSIGLD